MKILVIHGPNLNILGGREPELYGTQTLDSINEMLTTEAGGLGVELDTFQSNSEGELVTAIQQAEGTYDVLIINAASFTHTSLALRDAIAAIDVPAIEVHLQTRRISAFFLHRPSGCGANFRFRRGKLPARAPCGRETQERFRRLTIGPRNSDN